MLDDLRTYLREVPILAELLQNAIYKNKSHATNTEEQRFYIEELHAAIMKDLKERKAVYGVAYNPDFENSCPICQKQFKGTYYELNNAATGKAIVSSMRLVHALIEHEQTYFQEQMYNVSGTRVGEMRLVLDMGAILATLKGADVPPEVMKDAETGPEIQKKQLEEAGELAASGGH